MMSTLLRQELADVNDVAAAIVDRVRPIECMALQKLLYYTQAWNVAVRDQPLFGATVEAWKDGPVVDAVFQQHKGQRRISSWPSGHPERLDETSQVLIELVCGTYGGLSGDELSDLTHRELPWLEARQGYTPAQRGRREITLDSLKRFYRPRELAGRTTADLAAGGLAGFSRSVDNDADRARFERGLLALRAAAANSTTMTPSQVERVAIAPDAEPAPKTIQRLHALRGDRRGPQQQG